MTVLKISAAGLATLALLAGAQAHAQGVITFQSDAPAVGAAVQATQAGRAQAAKPPAQMPGINRVEMPPVSPEDSEAAQPVEQRRLVGVRGQPADGVDVRAHRDALAEQGDLVRAVDQPAAERAGSLETRDDHRALASAEVVAQVVLDPPGIATVSSQRKTPSFDSGSHRRLNTITRISASISMLCRVFLNTRRNSPKPSESHSSLSAQTLPSARADSNSTSGDGAFRKSGLPVTLSRPEMTESRLSVS